MVDKSQLNNTESPGQAIPFINIDQKSGKFEVTSEAMILLESIPRNFKVSVVAIAGPYRTGKSFLANRLLNQSQGFQIGSTTQACTKGIWIWDKPVYTSNDQVMLLLDTEGLASTERSTNVDIKIFTLSILLSSLFIYNQMGPITENSLEDLSLVANLSNYIHIQNQQTKDQANSIDYKGYFPQFNWVLRDFYHDLEGQTPKQYLEDCLQMTAALSNDGLKKNLIRESIKKYFKDRDCYTFIRPVSDESKLAHVDSLKWEELKTDFRREVSGFVKDMKKKLKPKIINGKFLNTSMFLSLALEYIDAINSKETPTVLAAIDRVIQAETSKIGDELYDKFCHQIEESISEECMPFTKETFQKIVKKLTKENKTALSKQLSQILNFQEILKEQQKFKERILDVVERKYQQNYSASYHYASGLINKLYDTVKNPMKHVNNHNSQVDSTFIHEYVKQWLAICKEYKEIAKCMTQWECFAESIVKHSDLNNAGGSVDLFIKQELIEINQEAVVNDNMDHDDSETLTQASYNYSSNQHQLNEDQNKYYALQIFEKIVDQISDSLNDTHNRLKINLQETQHNDKKLSQKKKQNDQMIELQRQQNEDIVNVKHELEMKIENLQREIQSRLQELDSLKQVKEQEAKNLKKTHERQLKDRDEEIKVLEAQKSQIDTSYQTTSLKAQELDSEKRKEISSIQNEIKKLEEDVEGLKKKMENKENNPHYIQVNQFFMEVKEYIEQFKRGVFDSQEETKNYKVKLFNLQKQLNDIEYQANQNELKLKKKLDEDLRLKKEGIEQQQEQYVLQLDQERQKIYQLQDKKQIYEQHIDALSQQISDAQKKEKLLQQQFETAERSQLLKHKGVQDVSQEIQSYKDTQLRIEEQIYKLSIENKQQQEDKEIILMLLPQIIKSINGRANNIKAFLNQMENDQVKNKVQKILLAHRIPFK
eukprot:403340994